MGLEINNLNIFFDNEKVQAVNDLSISIENGEILGLVGESGCGKSVTSLSIMRLLNKSSTIKGEINFNGVDLNKISIKEIQKIRGNEISMIFQEPLVALNPLHRVGKQIEEVIKKHTKLNKSERKDKVTHLMKEVNLPNPSETIKKFPHELSGGQRQRVVIAMAIACNPNLIIADEPTTALDVTTQAQIIDLIKGINQKYQNSVLFISHDLDLVNSLCDKIAIMYAGYIVEVINSSSSLSQVKHPYTKALLKSMPNPHMKGMDLEVISGVVPSLGQREDGCPFKRRCSRYIDRCNELPNLRILENKNLVRCSNLEEEI